MREKIKYDISNKVRRVSPDSPSEFASRIRFCSEKMGSAKKLAELSGIPASTISNYATDFSEPSRENLITLAKAAGVSLAWLVSGEGSADSRPEPLGEFDIVRNTAESLPDRIKAAIKQVGGFLPIELSLKVSNDTLRAFATGDKEPTIEQLKSIAELANFDLNWMVSGHGSRERVHGMAMPNARTFKHAPIQATTVEHTQKPEDICHLPVMTVEASAGDGAAVLKEDVQEYMRLSNALVRSLRLTPADTFIIFARGESMEPLIRGGDPILCSKAERHLKAGDGIYVLRLEGDILVKHVQRLPGGKVRVFSENSHYAPFEVTLGDGTDFAILGKVLHTLRQV